MPTQIDTIMLEKQQAFDRSKICVSWLLHRDRNQPLETNYTPVCACHPQERIVHPCGSSAFGHFQVTKDISHLTRADFLQPGKKTPTYTRFSTVTYGVSEYIPFIQGI